jgi:hypothetical protein
MANATLCSGSPSLGPTRNDPGTHTSDTGLTQAAALLTILGYRVSGDAHLKPGTVPQAVRSDTADRRRRTCS